MHQYFHEHNTSVRDWVYVLPVGRDEAVEDVADEAKMEAVLLDEEAQVLLMQSRFRF